MDVNQFEHFKNRAFILKKCRQWFEMNPALEVFTNSMSIYANNDANLDSFVCKGSTLEGYLNTSPEFEMKKLLANGCPDSFQIARVYRDAEQGRNHLPEFNLLEWYRLGIDEFQLMQEIENLFLFLAGNKKNIKRADYFSYNELFIKHTGIAVKDITLQLCIEVCQRNQLPFVNDWVTDNDIPAFLDFILSQIIAPKFNKDRLTFVYHYPANQCSLAKCTTTKEGLVAQRFEAYWGDLELGNGFNELQDANEQEKRFKDENKKRQHYQKPVLPIDIELIDALKKGLPQCSGVALGIERLLMVIFNKNHINLV